MSRINRCRSPWMLFQSRGSQVQKTMICTNRNRNGPIYHLKAGKRPMQNQKTKKGDTHLIRTNYHSWLLLTNYLQLVKTKPFNVSSLLFCAGLRHISILLVRKGDKIHPGVLLLCYSVMANPLVVSVSAVRWRMTNPISFRISFVATRIIKVTPTVSPLEL